MMKSRIPLYLLLFLAFIALGGIFFFYSLPDSEPIQVFPATVDRDCAPWDGAAFTLSFPYDPVTTITISIWQAPDIRFPSTFTFPDETRQVGYAYSVQELDPLEELSGEVAFRRVEQGIPVEGEFNFTSVRGGQFKGKFIAEWGDFVAMCG